MMSPGHAQAGETARNSRPQLEALSRTQVQRRGGERPTPEHTASRVGDHAQVLAVFDRLPAGPRRIGGCRILAPLPGVAVQVKEPVIVGLLAAHGPRPTVGILNVPGIVAEQGSADTAMAAHDRLGPAGTLPLGFRRQAVSRPPQVIRWHLHPRLDLVYGRIAHLLVGNPFLLA